MLAGGYNVHPCVGEDEMEIFKAAMSNYVGVGLKPVAVASQVVNGTNYIYICTGMPVVVNPEVKLYAVKIYFKFDGSCAPVIEVKEVKEIDVASLAG